MMRTVTLVFCRQRGLICDLSDLERMFHRFKNIPLKVTCKVTYKQDHRKTIPNDNSESGKTISKDNYNSHQL